MFKVPLDPANPTYRHAQTITFWQWLTSSAAQRQEWRRRRDAVGKARVDRADARVAQAEQARQQRKAAKQARKAARRGGTYKTH